MTTTTTTTKRTTKKATPPVVPNPYELAPNESVDECAARLMAIGDGPAYAALDIILAAADAAADADDYRGRIARAKRAGDAARGNAARISGEEVKTFADVSKALGMTDKNSVTFAGRAYSTLREAFRMSVAHDADGVDEFIEVWTKVYGRPPQNVRDCLAWLERIGTPEEFTENDEDAYREAKAERERASAKAATTAEAGRIRTKELVKDGCVKSIDLITPAMWAAFTVDQYEDIARLATVFALKAKAKATKETAKNAAEAIAREAMAETGGERELKA